MPVEVPAEPVYYYECSNCEFRLIYSIPANELERLVAEGKADKKVLYDYPDGADLTCSETDFAEFHHDYGYRPAHDPEALRNAFYAIWTDTRNWQKTTAAGFIPAGVIEENLPVVEEAAPPPLSLPRGMRSLRAPAPVHVQVPLKARRKFQKARESHQRRLKSALKRMRTKGVNRRKTLDAQDFGKIKMQKGEPAQELFIRLNQNREGE
ncbi:MAG: hypothetical protein HKN82_14400 [Akkermansiaceae bacterium]|nr:hypothetical protein [Akkermansiaceae bacterium]